MNLIFLTPEIVSGVAIYLRQVSCSQHTVHACNVPSWIHPNFGRPLQKGLTIIYTSLHWDFQHQGDQFLSDHLVISYVYFGDHLGDCLSIKSVLHSILVVACTSGLIALWYIMFVWVVAWLVAVPVHHLGRSCTYYQS